MSCDLSSTPKKCAEKFQVGCKLRHVHPCFACAPNFFFPTLVLVGIGTTRGGAARRRRDASSGSSRDERSAARMSGRPGRGGGAAVRARLAWAAWLSLPRSLDVGSGLVARWAESAESCWAWATSLHSPVSRRTKMLRGCSSQ